MISRLLTPFNTALAFLSILRIPGIRPHRLTERELAAGFGFFPLVGLILGALLLAAATAGSRWWPAPLAAAWVVTLQTLLTRGLHLDGLSDCADGIGGAYEPAKRLIIMKDSRVGAFGVLAIALAVLVKVVAISSLISGRHWASLCLAPVCSRYAMVLVAYKSPYARKEGGLGKAFLENLEPTDLIVPTLSLAILALLLVRSRCWIYLVVLTLVVVAIRRGAIRTLGGVTGDVLGATNEITEMLIWSLAVALG